MLCEYACHGGVGEFTHDSNTGVSTDSQTPIITRKADMNTIDTRAAVKYIEPHIRDDHARQLRSDYLLELFGLLYRKCCDPRITMEIKKRRPLDSNKMVLR